MTFFVSKTTSRREGGCGKSQPPPPCSQLSKNSWTQSNFRKKSVPTVGLYYAITCKFTHNQEYREFCMIKVQSSKSCNLDPMATPLVIDCIDVLLPIITKIINLSLESGMFPDACPSST